MGQQSKGLRPWAYWKFTVGEDPPAWDREDGGVDMQPIRLAELGLLTSEELAAFEEDATVARPLIGTPSEQISGRWREHGVSLDVRAVEWWDRIKAPLP